MKARKTTRAFKEIMFHRDIVQSIKFIGARMYFPYTWNGERKYALIELGDLFKIVKWDREIELPSK